MKEFTVELGQRLDLCGSQTEAGKISVVTFESLADNKREDIDEECFAVDIASLQLASCWIR